VVLDPFAGSGGLLLAARAEGRGGVGLELLPRWVRHANEELSAAAEPSDDISL
jgi:DNA modification methylase